MASPFTFQLTLSPAAVAINTTAEQLFNITGLGADPFAEVSGGGVLIVNKPTAQAGLGIVGARLVPGAVNQVGITFSNNTAGAITPTAAEVYLFCVVPPTSPGG